MKRHRTRFAVALAAPAAITGAVTLVCSAVVRPRTGFGLIKVVYDSATITAPLLLLAIAAIAYLRFRRRVLPAVFAFFAAGGLGLRGYATHVEPYQLQIRSVEIRSAKVDRPIRLLHISDVQSARVSGWEEEVFATIARLKPDLLVHTGDLVQPRKREQYPVEYGKLAPLIASVPAPLGRYNVHGDTDWAIRDLLRRSRVPIRTLFDESHQIELGGGRRLRLLGLDVHTARHAASARAQIQAFIEQDPDAFNVVFAHPPDFILEAKDYAVDLSLAGHTHGGQVQLPFFGPPIVKTRAPRHLARGYHSFGKTRINTSAGIGAERAEGLPPIRINCPPEVTLITIVPARPPSAELTRR